MSICWVVFAFVYVFGFFGVVVDDTNALICICISTVFTRRGV